MKILELIDELEKVLSLRGNLSVGLVTGNEVDSYDVVKVNYNAFDNKIEIAAKGDL